jgi:hypothetical protein
VVCSPGWWKSSEAVVHDPKTGGWVTGCIDHEDFEIYETTTTETTHADGRITTEDIIEVKHYTDNVNKVDNC